MTDAQGSEQAPAQASAQASADGGTVASAQSNMRLTPNQRALAVVDRWHGDVRTNLGRELTTEQLNQLTGHVEALKTAIMAALASPGAPGAAQ